MILPPPAVANRDELRPGTDIPSNVIMARISEGQFPVTIDALYTLFSLYGRVQKVREAGQRPCRRVWAGGESLGGLSFVGLASSRRF